MKKIMDRRFFCGFTKEKHECYYHIKLTEIEDKKVILIIRGSIKFANGGYIKAPCQCIDEIAKFFPNNKRVQRVCEIWEKYHMNNLHAGCVHQREFEKEPYEKHKGCHCDICNYTYGHGWQFEEIPQDIIDEIKSW